MDSRLFAGSRAVAQRWLPRLEVNRTASWYSLAGGDMRSTLAAILNLYGFSLVEGLFDE